MSSWTKLVGEQMDCDDVDADYHFEWIPRQGSCGWPGFQQKKGGVRCEGNSNEEKTEQRQQRFTTDVLLAAPPAKVTRAETATAVVEK